MVKIYHRDNCFEHPTARAKKKGRSVIYLNGQMGHNVFLQSDLIWSLTGYKNKWLIVECPSPTRMWAGVDFSAYHAPGAGWGLRSASLGTGMTRSRNYKEQEQHFDSPQGVFRTPAPSVNVRGAEANMAGVAERMNRSLLLWQNLGKSWDLGSTDSTLSKAIWWCHERSLTKWEW